MQNPEKIPTVISDDPDALSVRVADRIVTIMQANAMRGRKTVLGLATGSTPVAALRVTHVSSAVRARTRWPCSIWLM